MTTDKVTRCALLTLDEAAERSRVTKREMLTHIRNGALPHIYLGKNYLIHPQDLVEFWNRHRIRANTAYPPITVFSTAAEEKITTAA